MKSEARIIDDRKARLWRMANLTAGGVLLTYCLMQVVLSAGGAQ